MTRTIKIELTEGLTKATIYVDGIFNCTCAASEAGKHIDRLIEAFRQ